MTERENQREIGVITVLGAFSLIAAIGVLLFLLMGSSSQSDTTDLPSGADKAAAVTRDGMALGDADPLSSPYADGASSVDRAHNSNAGSTAGPDSGSGAEASAGTTHGSSGDTPGGTSDNSPRGSKDGSPESSAGGSAGSSAGTSNSGSSGNSAASPGGTSAGSSNNSAPSPGNTGESSSPGSPTQGATPTPETQANAEAAGIKILTGDMQIVTFNTHQSGVTVVFFIPQEMRGFGSRSVIPPMTVTPSSDGRSVTVRVSCHSSAAEVLGQLSVSETNRQVLVAGAVVVPSQGGACVNAAPLTVELPLRQPLGERLLTVLPAT